MIRASDLKAKGIRSDLLVNICKEMGADEYLSGPSGRNYLDDKLFKNEKIRVTYHEYIHPAYPQKFGGFSKGLSIIDMLANCGSDSRAHLISSGSKSVI